MAEHVDADAFEFFGIAPGGSFDGFGTSIAENPEGDSGVGALLFIALEAKGQIMLTEAVPSDFDALVVLLPFEEERIGGGQFEEFFARAVLIFITGDDLKTFEDLAGGDGGGAEGDGAIASSGEIDCELGEFFGFGNGLAGIEPALVAAFAPVVEILVIDGFAFELGGEDFFDAGKGVEPGENIGSRMIIEEATVELLTDVFGETGNFTNKDAGHR